MASIPSSLTPNVAAAMHRAQELGEGFDKLTAQGQAECIDTLRREFGISVSFSADIKEALSEGGGAEQLWRKVVEGATGSQSTAATPSYGMLDFRSRLNDVGSPGLDPGHHAQLSPETTNFWPDIHSQLSESVGSEGAELLHIIATNDVMGAREVNLDAIESSLWKNLEAGGALYNHAALKGGRHLEALVMLRNRKLAPRVREVLKEELGSDALKGKDYLVVGMPRSKVADFDIDPNGRKLWAAFAPGTAEFFGQRAGARTGQGPGAVILVFPEGAVKPATRAIDDMPSVMEVVLDATDLQALWRRGEVIVAPDLFSTPQ